MPSMRTLPKIHKRPVPWLPSTKANYQSEIEVDLLVHGGQLLSFSFMRPYYRMIRARKFHVPNERGIISTQPFQPRFGCVVKNQSGTVFAFGAINEGNFGNTIERAVLTPGSWYPGSLVTCITAPSNLKAWNCSIVYVPGTGYVMAVELMSLVRFYVCTSENLDAWVQTGVDFTNPQQGVGGPSLYYANGKFWLTYLKQALDYRHSTRVAYTPNLYTPWTEFENVGNARYGTDVCLLAPDIPNEGANTSDVSLAEFNGVTHGVYIDGDQATVFNVRTFMYPGTLAQLFWEFDPAAALE